MYCQNFIKSFTNNVIKELTCPCQIKNYIHYDSILSDFIYENSICCVNPHIETYRKIFLNCLLTYLHEGNLKKSFELLRVLKNYKTEQKEQIIKHLICYKFDEVYIFKYKNQDWKNFDNLTINQNIHEIFYKDSESLIFKDWFKIYFDL